MIQNYKVMCRCGCDIVIQVESSCPHLRVFCQKCSAIIYNHTPCTGKIAQTKQHSKETFQQAASASTVRRQNPDQENDMAKRFAGYLIKGSLGSGCMGNVYLGVNEKTGEKVALKVLHKPENTRDVDYFLREAQVLLQLNHPNIVRIKGRGNHNGYPYIAMEYIEGKPLEAIVKDNAIGVARAAQIIHDVLSALEYAEKFQIIHRDIKPANIFLAVSGETKLIDMGMGKVLGEGYGNLTKTGQAMGTPYYMPLEQILDAKRADYRSDVYAVGATLYHSLCGTPPYSKYKRNLQSLLRAKMSHKYTPLSQKASHLPDEIIRITEKAMSHNPNDRYPNAAKMKREIAKFIERITQV